MNKNQKIVLAIFIPIIIFFITLTIAYYTGVTTHTEKVTELFGRKLSSPQFFTRKTYNPFDWEKTWYIWMLYLIFCCIFEYKLFADKKDKQ
ncbi:MAG TPA: hypothetical protein VMZ91_03775 [Candidatus Paceibacterota bacterium]|nr:hypothetical protein [Candidatus Paceibacterota bacterium]